MMMIIIMMPGFGFLVILSVVGIATSSCPSGCECDGNSINCSSQELTDIPRDLPSNSVDSLDVSSNGIKSLKNDSFLGFTKLSTLYLSYNEIQGIHVNAFVNLRKLREIDLSNNELQFIHPDTFSKNPHLEVVSLSANPFTYLPQNSPFLISPTVRSLDLSLCFLNNIYSETFSNLTNLHILDLSSNHLQKLSLDPLIRLKHLSIVEFGNNRWSCSCETQKLVQWANDLRVNVPAHRPVKCIENGQHKILWSVTDPDQPCKNNIESDTILQEVEKLATQDPTVKLIPKISMPEPRFLILIDESSSSTQVPKESTLKQESTSKSSYNAEVEVRESESSVKKDSVWDSITSWNTTTVVVFIVLPCTLGVSLFITLMLVNYFTHRMTSSQIGVMDRRKSSENSYTQILQGEDMDRRASSEHIYEEILPVKPRGFGCYSSSSVIS